MNELLFKPVRELAELLRTRQVSPVELTAVALERLDRHGPTLNAVVTVTRERALAQAARAEQEIMRGEYRGPLHGDSIRREGSARDIGGDTDDVGRGAVQGSALQRRRDGHQETRAGWGCPVREAGDDRACGGHGLPPAECLVHGSAQEPLGHDEVDRRVVKRFGRGYCCRTAAVCHWLGDVGIDHRPRRDSAALRVCGQRTGA